MYLQSEFDSLEKKVNKYTPDEYMEPILKRSDFDYSSNEDEDEDVKFKEILKKVFEEEFIYEWPDGEYIVKKMKNGWITKSWSTFSISSRKNGGTTYALTLKKSTTPTSGNAYLARSLKPKNKWRMNPLTIDI